MKNGQPYGLIVAMNPEAGESKEFVINSDGTHSDMMTGYLGEESCRAWWQGQPETYTDGNGEQRTMTWTHKDKVQAAIGWTHEMPDGGRLSFVAWVDPDGTFHVYPVMGKVIVHETPEGLWFPSGSYGPNEPEED